MRHFNFLKISVTFWIVLIIILTSSCERRPLYVESDAVGTFSLVVKPRWTELGSRPDGMTVCVYPSDGSPAITNFSNYVDSMEVRLPAGTYRVIVYNGTDAEFAGFTFQDMDYYDDSHLTVTDDGDNTTTKAFSLQRVSQWAKQPEQLAVDKNGLVTVTQEEIDACQCGNHHVRKVLNVRPVPVVSDLQITVNATNLTYASSIVGVIEGMAQSYYLGYTDASEATVAHIVTGWTKNYASINAMNGTLVAHCACFNTPGAQFSFPDRTSLESYLDSIPDATLYTQWTRAGSLPETRSRSVSDAKVTGTFPTIAPEEAVLHLYVLMADLKTVVEKQYKVGDLIVHDEEDPLKLYLEVGPLELPIVDPAPESGANGFSADVEDWIEKNYDVYF